MYINIWLFIYIYVQSINVHTIDVMYVYRYNYVLHIWMHICKHFPKVATWKQYIHLILRRTYVDIMYIYVDVSIYMIIITHWINHKLNNNQPIQLNSLFQSMFPNYVHILPQPYKLRTWYCRCATIHTDLTNDLIVKMRLSVRRSCPVNPSVRSSASFALFK